MNVFRSQNLVEKRTTIHQTNHLDFLHVMNKKKWPACDPKVAKYNEKRNRKVLSYEALMSTPLTK